MSAPLGAPLQAVLFCCSLNAVRSPMAEALAKKGYGSRLYIDSAGLVKTERDPFALSALEEIGIDFTEDTPRTLDEIDPESFDLVIALSPEAHLAAADHLRATAVELIYWPVDDATQATGTREQRMLAYRAVRDYLMARIEQELSARLGAAKLEKNV